MSPLFIQITPETSFYTIASNLTKMQYRVWLFLYHLDPFGDRPVLIPTPVELAGQLNMSVRSIQRALKKLSELGLFTIRSTYQRAITNGVKNKPLDSKHYRQRIFNQNDKNVAATTKMSSTATKLAQPRQNCRQQSPQPNTGKGLNFPQTNTDNRKTLSDIEGDKNINSMTNSQELVDYWFEDEVNNPSSIATKDPGKGSIVPVLEQLNENNCSNIEAELTKKDRPKDNNSAIVNSDRSAIALSNWLPPGPWSIEGKLDPNFRDWLAKDWVKEYGGTIHQKRANVLAYFQNKPTMLPVRWEQYHSEYVDRYTNAQTRMSNGMSIDIAEQQQLIDNAAAVSKPLPAPMSPVADKKRSSLVKDDRADLIEIKALKAEETEKASSSINNQALHNLSNHQEDRITAKGKSESVIDWGAIGTDEEIPENPDAYKLLQPRDSDPKAAIELLKSAFTMKKPLTKPKAKLSENPIAKLNSWLFDPILYPEAIARAKKLGYSIEYNENGRAISIYELEF